MAHKIFYFARLFFGLPLVLLGIGCFCFSQDNDQSGKELERVHIQDKSFELTTRANQWLKMLDSIALGYLAGPEKLRLLYAVDPEYEDYESFAILAVADSQEVTLTYLENGKISKTVTAIDTDQWSQMISLLKAEKIWKKPDFYELMLGESKNSVIWMVEHQKGVDSRLFLTENLTMNARHSFDGAIPERFEFASLFSIVFQAFLKRLRS